MTDTNTATMIDSLKATDDAVRAKGWVAPGLGVPGAPLGLLEAGLNPLGALATAGLGWFMPLVSFLGEGLTQLQGGDGSSVSSGSDDFGKAGKGLGGVAEDYRESAAAQTSGWSGAAATQYREAAAQHADGVEGLGQASTGVGSAIIGAGQVVAQAIAEVAQLIAEAVAQIVPIMTQAIARAAETFGQSVVEAIPPCVAIAVEYALKIVAKLAALVASGDNLLKLVQGGMAVVELIQQALSSISGQSVSPENEAPTGAGGGGQNTAAASTAQDVKALEEWESGSTTPAGESGGGGSSAPASSGGYGGAPSVGGTSTTPSGASTVGGPFVPRGSLSLPDVSTRSSGALPPVSSSTLPGASRLPGHLGGSGLSGAGASGVPVGGSPVGAVPAGGAGTPGARVGSGRDSGTTRPDSRQVRSSGGGAGAPGSMPVGGVGGARQGEGDKEHQRKYTVVEDHEEEAVKVAPQVITGGTNQPS